MRNKILAEKVADICSNEYGYLLDMISNNGGFLTIDMGYLKEITGHNTINKKTNKIIKKSLSKKGISHHPNDLPLHQNNKVRLY
jgi:hypothetical protein